jgi:hypothetical protein
MSLTPDQKATFVETCVALNETLKKADARISKYAADEAAAKDRIQTCVLALKEAGRIQDNQVTKAAEALSTHAGALDILFRLTSTPSQKEAESVGAPAAATKPAPRLAKVASDGRKISYADYQNQ